MCLTSSPHRYILLHFRRNYQSACAADTAAALLHMQFLASWRYSNGPDDMFDSFFIANLHAAMCLAESKGAVALRTPRVQALLSAIAQPDTAALIAHALVALAAQKGGNNGAQQAWQLRLSRHWVPPMRANLQKREKSYSGPWYEHVTLLA